MGSIIAHMLTEPHFKSGGSLKAVVSMNVIAIPNSFICSASFHSGEFCDLS